MHLYRSLIVASIALSLAACAGSLGGSPATPIVDNVAHSGPFPPACTTPLVKNGQYVTSISAFGSVTGGAFKLAGPSSWMQVEWLSAPPPNAVRHPAARAPRTSGNYLIYWGTYHLTDKTTGCLYVVTPSNGKAIDAYGNASLTAQPHIPDTGATLPEDFGNVKALTLHLESNGTGKGTVTLTHLDGSAAMTGTLTIVGEVARNG